MGVITSILLFVNNLFGITVSKLFNISDGKITAAAGGRFQTSSAEMRATLKAQTAQNITVNFTYLGATTQVSKLGDGTIRHQFGVKMNAQDICNLVYVMWHFEQTASRLEVLVKNNPGQSTSAQCADNGYTVVAQIPIAYAGVDKPHSLTAKLNGTNLIVSADGVQMWQGTLPAVAGTFKGPLGFRSDNAHVVWDYTVGAN